MRTSLIPTPQPTARSAQPRTAVSPPDGSATAAPPEPADQATSFDAVLARLTPTFALSADPLNARSSTPSRDPASSTASASPKATSPGVQSRGTGTAQSPKQPVPHRSMATDQAEKALVSDTPLDADDVAAAELRSQSPSTPNPPQNLAKPALEARARPDHSPESRGAEGESGGHRAPTDPTRSDPPSNPSTRAQNSASPSPTMQSPAPDKSVPGTRQGVALSGPVVSAPASATNRGAAASGIASVGSVAAPALKTAAPTSVQNAATSPTNGKAALARLGSLTARPTLTQSPTAEDGGVTAQMATGLAKALRQGGGTVAMRLRPENLGAVSLEVTVRGDAVGVFIEAESDSARDLLSNSIPLLRESLTARGLRVERIDIAVSAEPASHTPPAEAGLKPEDDGTNQDRAGPREESGMHDQDHGGAESHADRRHAGSEGRTDASDADESDGASPAAEPWTSGVEPDGLAGSPGHATTLRLDALA